jgi:hypothetical protein
MRQTFYLYGPEGKSIPRPGRGATSKSTKTGSATESGGTPGAGETNGDEASDVATDPLPSEVATRRGPLRIDRRHLAHGASSGVELLTIRTAKLELSIVPTRGMGIWKARGGDVDFGWRSPVHGPVHPSLVPLDEPTGLGWLSGFDELLVRCGLESNGAPAFDDRGRLVHPLHGRIANTPAESLVVTIDDDLGIITVTGVMRENRLFFANWTLSSTIRLQVDSDTVEIEDRVTNGADSPRSHQLLYHINVGTPVLGPGARLIAPAKEVVPKTAHAAEGLDQRTSYGPPTPGFAEQVYLMRPAADSEGWAQSILVSPDRRAGLGLRYDTSTLPYFVQWKNTGGMNDGYVTGMEPATNFPNSRTFEASKDRVVTVPPASTVTYRIELSLLHDAERVSEFVDETEALAPASSIVHAQPQADWCESDG